MRKFSKEQLVDARLQARAKRLEQIDAKHEEVRQAREKGENTIELERELAALYDDFNARRVQRREAKAAARDLREQIQAGIGKPHAIRWNNTPAGREARDSVKEIRKAEMKFALQPGQMVKLINDARVAQEGQWIFEKTLPKGSIGILIDPPACFLSAVMFGTNVWKVPTKKLRAADIE
jgi:hypothetical protein